MTVGVPAPDNTLVVRLFVVLFQRYDITNNTGDELFPLGLEMDKEVVVAVTLHPAAIKSSPLGPVKEDTGFDVFTTPAEKFTANVYFGPTREELDTPEVPLEPETPVTPEVPDEPVWPEVPDEPVAPVMPEVPDEPVSPVIPEVPLEPVIPEVPLEPVVPVMPEVPDEPV